MTDQPIIKTNWLNKQIKTGNGPYILVEINRHKKDQVKLNLVNDPNVLPPLYKTIEVPVNDAGSLLIKKTGHNLIGFMIYDIPATLAVPDAFKVFDPDLQTLLLGFGFIQDEKGDWQYENNPSKTL